MIETQLYAITINCLVLYDSLVFLDIKYSVPAVTQSLHRVVPAEAFDEHVSIASDLPGEFKDVNALQDVVVRLHWVRASEGGTAKHRDFYLYYIIYGHKNTVTSKLTYYHAIYCEAR